MEFIPLRRLLPDGTRKYIRAKTQEKLDEKAHYTQLKSRKMSKNAYGVKKRRKPHGVWAERIWKICNTFATQTPQIAPNGHKLWQMLENQHGEKVPKTNRFRSISETFLLDDTELEPVTPCTSRTAA